MTNKKYKLFQNPLKWYIQKVKDSVEPTDISHRIRMNINIKKGETEGRALIPCSIYSFDHSIDLNPALIMKKDGNKIKELPINKRVSYDSKKYRVELTEQEKKLGYTLKELEKCDHCGQRLVIAEIAETRYRSCPDIKVRIADKSKEDLKIPVDFGINKSDVFMGMWGFLILDILILSVLLSLFIDISPFFPKIIESARSSFSDWILIIFSAPLLGLALIFFMVILGRVHYRSFKLWEWWIEVKPTLTKLEKS